MFIAQHTISMKSLAAAIILAGAASLVAAESYSKGGVFITVQNCTNVVGDTDPYVYVAIDESATKKAQHHQTGLGKIISGKAAGPNTMTFKGSDLTFEKVANPTKQTAEIYIYGSDVLKDDKLGAIMYKLSSFPANCQYHTAADLPLDSKYAGDTTCTISFAICPSTNKPKPVV